MGSPVFFSDYVQGQSTNTQSIFPIDKITRNYTCEQGYYALTFDDGPFPQTTPKLVEVLEKNKIPATFFNLGMLAQRHPDLVSLEKRVGDVGGHSFGHDDYSKLSPFVVAKDIERTKAEIPGIKLFRPPYGASNELVRKELRKAGLLETMWTVDTKDFEPPYTVDKLVDRASKVKAGGNILFHDGWPATIRAIPAIVNDLYARGLCPGKLVASDEPSIMMDVGSYSPYPFYVKAVKP
jgi:peptidoglycan-N-acetylglucosamine deacetylase